MKYKVEVLFSVETNKGVEAIEMAARRGIYVGLDTPGRTIAPPSRVNFEEIRIFPLREVPVYWDNMSFEPENGEPITKSGVYHMVNDNPSFKDLPHELLLKLTRVVWSMLTWEHPSTVLERVELDRSETGLSWEAYLREL